MQRSTSQNMKIMFKKKKKKHGEMVQNCVPVLEEMCV